MKLTNGILYLYKVPYNQETDLFTDRSAISGNNPMHRDLSQLSVTSQRVLIMRFAVLPQTHWCSMA